MFGLLGGVKYGVGALAGLALGVCGMWIYGQAVSLPAAREIGRQEERVVAEEGRRRAEALAESRRQSAEERIRQAEAQLVEREAAHAGELADLEAALMEERDHVPLPSPSPGAAVACAPALPRGRVRDQLDRVGRAAPRADPAEPHRAMP